MPHAYSRYPHGYMTSIAGAAGDSLGGPRQGLSHSTPSGQVTPSYHQHQQQQQQQHRPTACMTAPRALSQPTLQVQALSNVHNPPPRPPQSAASSVSRIGSAALASCDDGDEEEEAFLAQLDVDAITEAAARARAAAGRGADGCRGWCPVVSSSAFYRRQRGPLESGAGGP